ncbi:MAG: FAD:protein FMN transferase [Phycisphaerales bacterium]
MPFALLIIRLAPLALVLLASCSAPLKRYEFTRICMGVPARIVLYTSTESRARDAASAAYARIARIEQALSDYRPDSENGRLCSHPVGVPVPISQDLAVAIETARRVHEASGGEFDITIGPATRLWREARRTGNAPHPSRHAEALSKIGFRRLHFDSTNRTVTLELEGMSLDFGGIGKGLAAQSAVDRLRELGCSRCLVSLAGDIALGAAPPDSPGWRVRIDPDSNAQARSPLLLSDAAVSTSGDAEQVLVLDDRRESHIIDPATARGRPDRRSVTVIAPRGELADALSSAAWLLGASRAESLISGFEGSAAIFAEETDSPDNRTIIDPHGILSRLRQASDRAEPRVRP